MESRPPKAADEPPAPLVAMHAACLRDNKVSKPSPTIKTFHSVKKINPNRYGGISLILHGKFSMGFSLILHGT
jgi:hypothetical protein